MFSQQIKKWGLHAEQGPSSHLSANKALHDGNVHWVFHVHAIFSDRDHTPRLLIAFM